MSLLLVGCGRVCGLCCRSDIASSAVRKSGRSLSGVYPLSESRWKKSCISSRMSCEREQSAYIRWRCPCISPVVTPGECHECGGMKRCRASGLACRFVMNLPNEMVMSRSRNVRWLLRWLNS